MIAFLLPSEMLTPAEELGNVEVAAGAGKYAVPHPRLGPA